MKVLGHFNHAHAPNGTTTLVLNPRGPRRAALGSGPWGLALGPRCHEFGSVTPGSWTAFRSRIYVSNSINSDKLR